MLAPRVGDPDSSRHKHNGLPLATRSEFGIRVDGCVVGASWRLWDSQFGHATRETRVDQDRSSLRHKLAYARAHPDRIVPYVKRYARDIALRVRTRGDHVNYYRGVMRSDTARNPEDAVGSATHESWERIGRMQFDYLLGHGLRPEHRMLEIGCGNLRAGRHFVRHLEPGHYYGIDISPDILFEAQRTIVRDGLAEKLPTLTPVRDLTFAFLPDASFDVVHAHSVFSHSPLPVIEECFAHVGRVMAPGAFFDFTFDRTTGREHQVLHEDFYYRTETLIELAATYGLRGEFMADWERLKHKQSKIRLVHDG
jgi:SAM-dependent methyltransferase